MQRSWSRSSTSLLALGVLATSAAGCGDDAVCGAGDAPAAPITLAGGGKSRSFGDFTAVANNDCRTADPPAGVVSLTVFGGQIEAGAAFVTLCLPRPELIADGDRVALQADVQPVPDDARVQVIDLQGAFDDGCTWSLAGPPSGTAAFEGFCEQGLAAGGFAIALDGTATVDEECDGAPATPVEVTISGRVTVTPQTQP